MVDLGRQLGVAQARQGGFSAHILPQSIRYDAFEPIIAYATPSGFQVTGTYQSVSIPTLAAGQILSGAGPFGETAAGGVNLGETNLYTITLGNASPGTTDFTLEWWFKAVTVGGGGQFNMAGIGTAAASSYGQIRFGTTESAGQIFFEHFVLGGGGSRTTQATLPLSTWRHAAIVRAGVNHRSYLNGALVSNVIASQNYGSNEPINFSSASVNGGVFTGINMGQLRYTKAAIYSGDTIAVPTAPFFVPS